MSKKAISPIIATIILITIVITTAIIIFNFSINLIPEPILLSGYPIENFCTNLKFEAGLFGDDLEIINQDSIPFQGINIKISREGSLIPINILQLIESGKSISISLSASSILIQSGDTLIITPVLQGQTEKGKTSMFTCPDSSGKIIEVS